MRGKVLRSVKQLRAFFRYVGRGARYVLLPGGALTPLMNYGDTLELLPDGRFVTRSGQTTELSWDEVEYVRSEQ